MQSVCFALWSSSGAAQKSCPGMLLSVLYMKDVEAGTWLVVVLDTDPNGTHGHNEKKKKNKTH